MATLRAAIVLEDRVSRVLDRMNRNAARYERGLANVERRLERMERTSEVTSRRFAYNMERMERQTTRSTGRIVAGLIHVERRLQAVSGKRWSVKVEADTGGASAQLAVIQSQLNRIAGSHVARVRVIQQGGVSSMTGNTTRALAGGALAGTMARGGGSSTVERVGRPVAGTAGRMAGAATEGLSGTVSANLGPLGLSGGKLAVGLMTLGPLIASTAAAAVGVLVPALMSVAAGMVSAGSATGAWATGLLAVGIPVGMAIGRLKDLHKEVGKAKDALDKAKPGTETYTKALDRYNAALAAGSPLERAALRNYGEMANTWDRLVTKGKSGEFALKLINSGLQFAETMIPFVAKQMDRFTSAAATSFQTITRDAPALKNVLTATFEPFPGYFRDINLGLYDMLKGLAGLARGAKPFTDFLVGGFRTMMADFTAFTNSADGQMSMRRWFAGMIPVFKAVVDLVWEIGKAFVNISGDPAMQRHTIDFINWLIVGIKALPGFIRSATDAVSELGPMMHDTFKALALFITDVTPVMTVLLGHFNGLTQIFNELPAPARKALEALLAFQILGGMGRVRQGINGISGAIDVLTRGASRKSRDIKMLAGSMALFNTVGTSSALTGGVLAPLPGRGGKLPVGAMPGPNAAASGAMQGAAQQSSRFAGPLSMGAASGTAFGLNSLRAGSGASAGAAALGTGGAAAGGIGLGAIAIAAAAVVAAVGAAYLSIKENFNGINGYISDTMSDIGGHFTGIGEIISDFFNDMGLKNSGFVDTMSQLWNGLKPVIQTVGNILIVAIGESLELVIRLAGNLIRVFGGVINFLVGTFTGDWTQAWNGIKDIFGGVWDSIKAVVSGVKDFIVGVVTDIAGLFGIEIGRNDSKGGGKAVSSLQTGPSLWNPMGVGVNTSGGGTTMNPNVTPGGGSTTSPGVGDGLAGVATSALMSMPGGMALAQTMGLLTTAGKAGAKKLDEAATGRIHGLMNQGGIKGLAGGGINWAYNAVKDKLGFDAAMSAPAVDAMGGGGGGASASGLSSAAAAMLAFVQQNFGVRLSSGLRHTMTESGNLSLHALGQAIDVVGSPQQMSAVWQALQGHAGIKELIYAGMASYNGGAPVPYSGANKHYDHVHIGMGDGPGVSRVPMRAGNDNNSGGGRVTLLIEKIADNIEIKNGQDTEEWAREFAEEVKRQLMNMPHEDAALLGGD